MQVHRDIEHLPAFRKPVLTIGTFDGVHLGHRQILSQMQAAARKANGETVILTFHPHPRTVVKEGLPSLHLINTIEERIELLTPHIDHLVIIPFTEQFSQMPAKTYLDEFLVKKFHPEMVIIGYDHRFGTGRKGDYQLLEAYMEKGIFQLIEIPPHILNNNTISSTRIREAITNGELESANTLLGYDFFFEGKVIEGNKLGRTIGFPTANLEVQNTEKLIPGNGVYAVFVRTGNNNHSIKKGMMNIGFRPTIGGTIKKIEVNLFDTDMDLYSKKLRVYVKRKLRDEVKFASLDELKQQLKKDKKEAEDLLMQ